MINKSYQTFLDRVIATPLLLVNPVNHQMNRREEQPGARKPTVQAKSATLKVKQPVKVTAGTSNVKQPVKVISVKVKPTVKAKPAKVKPTVKVNRQFKQPAMQTVKRAVKPRRAITFC